MTTEHKRIIVALDFAEAGSAIELASQLDPALCRLKIGKELFTRSGPALVERLQNNGFEIFLDLKFHDIPNTVARACRAAADLGVWMVNVHASGGRRMMVAAREAVEAARQRPWLIAVTVLTSYTDGELAEAGYAGSVVDTARHLAALTEDCALDGVVCSAQEAVQLRAERRRDFLLVTPGIRPAGAAADDQRRIVTPQQAIIAGADYLVIGRPITGAAAPLTALEGIQREVMQALGAASGAVIG
ncbi:MAG: orotidine-5'-phosphate decarboxylase [Gammaproteobacteria bacterium]|nr:orotidine-5'-phosphate decarboxylase [Gammaproteobacteria bacterium]